VNSVPRETGFGYDLGDTPLAAAAASAVQVTHGTFEPLPRPEATRVMVVANQKGGVGKTTSAVNLAAALAMQHLEVLVVDLDPQGNASTALGVPHHVDVPNVDHVIVDGLPMADVVVPAGGVVGLWCAPASIDLAGAEITLVPMVARETRLARALQDYLTEHEIRHGKRLDVVLIDCPPSLGLLTVNAFVAGQEVLIPVQCEYYALEGLGQLLTSVDMIRAHLNPALHVAHLLLTMFDARTNLSAEVATQVREHFGDLVLPTPIPRSVRVSEAPSHQQTVLAYDPGSPGARAYLQAAREMSLWKKYGTYPQDN
jgi:chromosome partitioning protein